MNQQLVLLMNLQKVDTEIKKEEVIINEAAERINRIKEGLSVKEGVFVEEKNSLESKEKEYRSKERLLEEINQRMQKLREKVYKITNQKELKAVDDEIAEAKKQKSAVESEMLAMMEGIEALSSGVKNKEKDMGQETNDSAVILQELEKALAEASGKISALMSRKEEALKGVEPSNLAEYHKVLKSKGDCAVTEMKDGICQGCHMTVPYKLANEVKKNNQMIRCESCARILYCNDNKVG